MNTVVLVSWRDLVQLKGILHGTRMPSPATLLYCYVAVNIIKSPVNDIEIKKVVGWLNSVNLSCILRGARSCSKLIEKVLCNYNFEDKRLCDTKCFFPM